MRIMLAADQSEQSERALTSILQKDFLESDTIRICMVINPFYPPPVYSFGKGNDYLPSLIRFRAWARLEALAQIGRNLHRSVEVEVCESRLPEMLAILFWAIRSKADCLAVCIWSPSGTKRRIVEQIFNALKGNRCRRDDGNTAKGSDEGPSWMDNKAA